MVSRVFSEDVIELDVVDLIGGFGLESLVNEGEFLLVAQKLNIVEDGAEASHGDESGSGAILVLEEGFDQESSESNLFSKSNEDGVEDLLFFVVQTILGVEDGRSVERLKSLGRVLLKILFGENVINLGVEFGVAYESRVVGDHVVVLKCFVLRDSEHDLLDVKNVTELLARHISLSEDIVILEEFKKSDSVFLALVHNFFHEIIVLFGTVEISPFLNVGGLELGGGSINNVLKAVSVSQEFSVTNLSVGFSVLSGNTVNLFDAQLVAEEDKDLTELLLRHLEMLVAIPVLEEGLGIESVLTDDFRETVKDGLNLR